jgi:hypothetical protein
MFTAHATEAARAEHIAEVTELTHVLIDVVTEQRTHRIALEALIAAFAAVAVAHPCCAQQAAHTARKVAALIETTPAPQSATHVH